MKTYHKVTAKMNIRGYEEEIIVYERYKSLEQAQCAIDSLRIVYGDCVIDAWVD